MRIALVLFWRLCLVDWEEWHAMYHGFRITCGVVQVVLEGSTSDSGGV